MGYQRCWKILGRKIVFWNCFSNAGRTGKEVMAFSSMRKDVFWGCNSFPYIIEKDSALFLKVDFCKANMTSKLSRLFMNSRLQGMMEGQYYVSLNHMFPFIAGFIDFATVLTFAKLNCPNSIPCTSLELVKCWGIDFLLSLERKGWKSVYELQGLYCDYHSMCCRKERRMSLHWLNLWRAHCYWIVCTGVYSA